jgi:hypothetical protein
MRLPGVFRANKRRGKASLCKRFDSSLIGRFLCCQAFALAAVLAAPSWGLEAGAQQPESQDGGAKAEPSVLHDPQLISGFQLLYQLKFGEARQRFIQWEQERPAQPLGPALEAASDLFEEFYRKGVLTSEFFLDDKRLLGGTKGHPDADLERQFASAAQRAEELARVRLQNQPKDPDALFALTLVGGMQADDLFLIQKRQLESLGHLREAERNARILLEIAPDTDDAYVALGAANYIIGCLPAYKRAMLWIDGVHGDKALGLQQLARTATSEHAHYLRPFAQLMLALAALREKNPDLSRRQLQALVMEFPENPLFAAELAKVTPVVTRAASPADP